MRPLRNADTDETVVGPGQFVGDSMAMRAPFDPSSVETFRYVSCTFDEPTGTASLTYAFDDTHVFVETITFPAPVRPLTPANRAAFDRVLFLLFLAAGVSYYKAAIPGRAVIEAGPATSGEVEFLRQLYFNGLGEFSFVNRVSMQNRPAFVFERREDDAQPIALSRRSLVAVGGGKDSCVSIETLRAGAEPMVLASVNQPRAIVETIEASGLPAVHATRTLSPRLFELNAAGAYNGHVPITAVVSLTLLAMAILQDCDSVIMSNERSASAGNLVYDGHEVNHQWSKSLDAERQLAELVHASVAPNLQYFSLLRPLSELDIARRFANETRYDSVFTSCNRAFRIDASRRIDHWCCDCDKCRFVYLALAPFTPPERLIDIFGRDVFDDETQAGGFDALIGWQANKPFECVGEVEESVAAFLLLVDDPAWQSHRLVKRFADEILPQLVLPNDVRTKPFVMADHHRVPDRYLEMLRATA